MPSLAASSTSKLTTKANPPSRRRSTIVLAFLAFLAACFSVPCSQSISIILENPPLMPRGASQCRCIPGDACWPTSQQWGDLNRTLHGRLLASPPLGASCHVPQYDETRCDEIRREWHWPKIHITSPTSVMNPYFQPAGASPCDPFADARIPCPVRRHIQLVINVTSAADITTSLAFARRHQLRVVIKNTGHEYMGKSSPGRGALTLWMHHLSSLSAIPTYRSAFYNGSAMRLGAGVLGSAAVRAAHEHKLRIVGGFCPSVGIAGGYLQGGGVFAVVVSVTLRAFPDTEPIGGARLVVPRAGQAGDDDDAYWAAFAAWQAALPALLDEGATAGYAITREAFFVQPVTVVGVGSPVEMHALLAPLRTRLDALKIRYELEVTVSDSFYEHYETYQGPLPWGAYPVSQLFSGRLIPRTTLDEQPDALLATVRRVTEDTRAFLGFVTLNVNASGPQTPPVAPNAVLPAWRHAALTVLAQSTWNYSAPREDGLARAREMTQVVVPALARLTSPGPAAGTYLNEADFGLVAWRNEFYGANWARLSAVKSRWDPETVLWAPTGVGSGEWMLEDEGRLCRPGVERRLSLLWKDWRGSLWLP